MVSALQPIVPALLAALVIQLAVAVPISRKPQSVSVFSPAATYNLANPLLRSRGLSNGRFTSGLYGGVGAYPLGGAGAYPLGGAGYSSYSSGYGAGIAPYYNGYGGYYPGHASSSYENYQTGHPLLGHSTTSKKSSQYVGNNYGFPSLGGSYEHSTNVRGLGAVYPGVYAPIGAKYGRFGNYDHYGFGGHGAYEVTPHYTKVTHTQTIPNYAVNKLRGYGK